MFAAGKNCQEIWTIKSNGTDPKRIARSVGGTATFDVGNFSWSTDGKTITHAACKAVDGTSICGGGYWDISVDGRTITPRAVAGSVLRTQQPLVRSVKVQVDVTGPIVYSGRMQAGSGRSPTRSSRPTRNRSTSRSSIRTTTPAATT